MLINCKECGYKYSSEAEKCPKCGMPNKDLMESRRKVQQQQQKKNQIRQEINNRYNYWKNIHENQVLLMIGFFGMLIGFAVGYGISYFFITKNVTDCINGGILFAFFGSMPIPFALKPPLFGAFAVYAIVAEFLKWNTAKVVTDNTFWFSHTCIWLIYEWESMESNEIDRRRITEPRIRQYGQKCNKNSKFS